jgi:hypothetical protein
MTWIGASANCQNSALFKGVHYPGDGPLHTLGLLEDLRTECKQLWGTSSQFYFRIDELLRELANPNLHDIPMRLPSHVEMWDQSDQHIRWVVAASASVAVGHAALDAAIASYPGQRFTLRNGVQVIREYVPPVSVCR